jgi:excisionase family DNA binding protein
MKTQNTDPTSPAIGIEEAAEIMRCGVEVVRKVIARGELPALQLTQRHWVLLRDDVIEYIRAQALTQAQARKVAYARSIAPRPPVPVPPAKPGEVRRRRPLPDLDALEITAGIRPK